MKRILVVALLLVGCDTRARLSAEYQAKKSALYTLVESATISKNGETLANNRAFARIRICPTGSSSGRIIDLEAAVDGNDVFEIVSPTSKRVWTDSGVLKDILSSGGYAKLDEAEISALNRALYNSLSSPKGFVLKGQGQQVMVSRADVQYDARIPGWKSLNKWVDPASLRPCW